jgi:hypothetical protein
MRTTRLKTMLVAAAVLGAACGGGHAIFDVDVFSFIQGTGGDTLHYTVPTGLPLLSVNNPPLAVTLLPGLGGSVVDTVQVTGAAAIENQTGAGTVSFKIFFSEDSNTVYTAGPAILTASGNAGPGVAVTPLVLNAVLTSAQDSLFTKKKLFVGVQAGVNNTSAQTLDGRLQLTALHLRLVVNDKLF